MRRGTYHPLNSSALGLPWLVTGLALLSVGNWLHTAPAVACTSILISSGATQDNSSLLTYAADSHQLYGSLMVLPPTRNAPGSKVEIIEWDSGRSLGTIPQIAETLRVVGHLNEAQVAIAESTFGGRPELVDPKGGIDYGSLMWLALQRARTARQAIEVMTSLVAEHGYASTGESFSISDPKEAWILEMIGKGPHRKGAVWVARRVPDGHLTAHANQARIQQFPQGDSRDTLYSRDVVSFAREMGYFDGKDADFSFADAYAPLDHGALRFCEARVWSVFRRAAPALDLPVDIISGELGQPRLPLWIKPERKLTVGDAMALMRDHFQGTPLDLSKGVGAGPFGLPYRWRPLTWTSGGQRYGNERAISTQQTGFSLVAQSRASLPDAIGGVLWFGVDDTFSTVYMPIYTSVHAAPPPLHPRTASLTRFSWDSAFWVFNVVAHQAYARYSDVIVDVQAVQRELEGHFLAQQPRVEAEATALYRDSPERARAYLAAYSEAQVQAVFSRWRGLAEDLFVKYLDGNVKDHEGHPRHPTYSDDWLQRIVAEDGDWLRVREQTSLGAPPEPAPGYYHNAAELGAWATLLPAGFDFSAQKLTLWRGDPACGTTPRCCAPAELNQDASALVVKLPNTQEERCGKPSWLVSVPIGTSAPLQIAPR